MTSWGSLTVAGAMAAGIARTFPDASITMSDIDPVMVDAVHIVMARSAPPLLRLAPSRC